MGNGGRRKLERGSEWELRDSGEVGDRWKIESEVGE